MTQRVCIQLSSEFLLVLRQLFEISAMIVIIRLRMLY